MLFMSACGARQIKEEWGELNINWHLEAFDAFYMYTAFWAAYGNILLYTECDLASIAPNATLYHCKLYKVSQRYSTLLVFM
jgi:hypothetical protein